MPNMTPERAQHELARMGESLASGAPISTLSAAFRTIAVMTYEYAVQVRIQENGQWHQVTEWNPDPNPHKPGHAPKPNERIVRRLASQPEEVKP